MPIYAYKCESCGHAKDVLQKMADEPLTDCPACGKPSFKKQLTAAGFQLKYGAAFAHGEAYSDFDFRDKFSPGRGAAGRAPREVALHPWSAHP